MKVVERTLNSICRALDKQTTLKLSNKAVSGSRVSYRVWGELRVEDLEAALAGLQFRLDQPLRWFTESAGVAREMAASVSFFRKLGCGQGVRAEFRVLHSGSIVLHLAGEI